MLMHLGYLHRKIQKGKKIIRKSKVFLPIMLHLLLRMLYSYQILIKKNPDLIGGFFSSLSFKNSGAQEK